MLPPGAQPGPRNADAGVERGPVRSAWTRGSGGRLAAFLSALAAGAAVGAGGAHGAPEAVSDASPLVIVLRVERLKSLPPAGGCLRREKLRLGAAEDGNARGTLCVTTHVDEPCGAECAFAEEERDLEVRLPGGWIRASLSGYVFGLTDVATGTNTVQERFTGPVTGAVGAFSSSSGTVAWEGDLAVSPRGDETGRRTILIELSG